MNKNIFMKKTFLIPVFIVLILFITLGYSKLMATLDIDADVNLSEVIWDVQFKDINILEGSFTNNDENYVRIDPTNPKKFSYNITLNEPEDFYEFTIKIRNNGTINALLSAINETGTTDSEIIDTPYIDYVVEGMPKVNSILNKKAEKTIRIRFEYLPDLGGESSYNVTKSIELDYVQN